MPKVAQDSFHFQKERIKSSLCNNSIFQRQKEMEKREALAESQDLENIPNNEETIRAKEDLKPDHVDGIVSAVEPSSTKEEHEYITGMKLGLVVAAVSLCCFLMLLDTAIVVTAS